MDYYKLMSHTKDFAELIGQTLVKIEGCEKGSGEIRFLTDTGKTYLMLHYQDCCEGVSIDDVVGDVADLIGTPILMAEEVTGDTVHPVGWQPGEYTESFTWTFYKLATIKGYVDIRWYGESNGYYSEGVDFALIPFDGTIDQDMQEVRDLPAIRND